MGTERLIYDFSNIAYQSYLFYSGKVVDNINMRSMRLCWYE